MYQQLENRNIGICILLSILTCGIYGIYWFIKVNDDVNRLTNDPQPVSGGIAFLLSLVTCGIYGIYWAYKMGERLKKLEASNGQASDNRDILYLILSLFGFLIVVLALIQDTLNRYAPVPAAPQQPYGQNPQYQQYPPQGQPYQQPQYQQYPQQGQPYQQPQQPQDNIPPQDPNA